MKTIAVIGGSGMVASRFIDLASKSFDITSLDEKTLNITDNTAVEKYFSENKYDAVINFAAYTNVDGAEAQKDDENGLAYKLNVIGPKNLAESCNEHNIFLVHISTDFVFPGTPEIPGPYSEDVVLPETQNGMGWYGWTKNRAEYMTTTTSNSCAIVRYGYPFRAAKYDLKLDWARNLIKLHTEHKLYPLFTDQLQSLIFIDDLVEPLSKIVDKKINGIFHIASTNTTTPYEAGSYLLSKYVGKPVEIQKGSMAEFLNAPGRTPRPMIGGLKTEITQEKLGMKFKTWQEMVDEFISQLKS
jgi:dTDP-4-dehydrorhamnose reductase